MRIYPEKIKLSVLPGTWLLFSFCMLFIPFSWLMAWLLAATIHELSHIAVLRFYKARIYRIQIGILGAQIQTEPLNRKIEFLSACAGPLIGVILSSLGRWVPRIAICALFQTVCNLIPYNNQDGVRILRCLLRLGLNAMQCDQVLNIISLFCRIVGFLAVIWIGSCLCKEIAFYILVFYIIRLIAGAKIPCKQRQQIVQ